MIILTPKKLNDSQINEVVVMSLTGDQPEMLEYDETTFIISDSLGAVGYVYEDGAVGVSELGVVHLFETLDELLSNWSSLK